MVDIDRGIFITEQMCNCYQATQRLFGDEFHAKTKGIRDAMVELKDKTGCSNVEAGLEVLKFMQPTPWAGSMLTMLVLAVTYDMSRESEVT